jgi:hypothetical protein
MADRHCRVTVVGADRRVDVAVPARAAIGEYVGSLALLCGEPDNDTMPAAWSLATPHRGTLSPTASLTESGITDGQMLYLRDLTTGEYDEPGVFEVHELAADAAERAGGPLWNTRARTAAILIAGAAWLVAVGFAALFAGSADGVPVGPLTAAVGLMLAMAGWTARSNRLAVPAPVRTALVLGAVPCLGITGWCIGMSRSGGEVGLAMAGLAVGVVAGTLVALLAEPGIVTLALVIAAGVAAVVTTTLVALHADLAGSAAVAALTGYAAVLFAPRAAGRLAASWAALVGENDTELTVVRARRLLAGHNILACLTLAIATVLLGAAPSDYAIALAVCLSVAVLLHTMACPFTAEALPAAVAGLAGLLSVLLFAPGYLGGPAWTTPAAGGGLGVLVLAGGLALSFRKADRTAGQPAWSRIAAAMCSIAAVPLAIGVFGVFGQLLHLGQHM